MKVMTIILDVPLHGENYAGNSGVGHGLRNRGNHSIIVNSNAVTGGITGASHVASLSSSGQKGLGALIGVIRSTGSTATHSEGEAKEVGVHLLLGHIGGEVRQLPATLGGDLHLGHLHGAVAVVGER